MKFLRPRSADSGLVTVLLVSDAELLDLIDAVSDAAKTHGVGTSPNLRLKKLKAELVTAQRAL